MGKARDEDGTSTNLFEARLDRTLNRIRRELKWSDDEFLENLGFTRSEYRRIQEGRSRYTLKSLESLCSRLGLNVGLLFSGKIDLAALVKQHRGDQCALPEKYGLPEHQLARTRAPKSVYEYIRFAYGDDYARTVLSRTQVHPVRLQDPMMPVSPQLLIDFLEELTFDGLSEHEVQLAGTFNYVVNAATEVGTILSLMPSPKDLYRGLHEDYAYIVDFLFNYRLVRLTESGCGMEVTVRQEAMDLFKTTIIGNRSACVFKQGVYASFLGHLGGSFAKVGERRCIYLGDSCCEIDLSWEGVPISPRGVSRDDRVSVRQQ